MTYPYQILKNLIHNKINAEDAENQLIYFFSNIWEPSEQVKYIDFNHKKIKTYLFDILGEKCVFCKDKMELVIISGDSKFEHNYSTLEHILPLSKGGPNHIDNLCLSCKYCNERRGNNILPFKKELLTIDNLLNKYKIL